MVTKAQRTAIRSFIRGARPVRSVRVRRGNARRRPVLARTLLWLPKARWVGLMAAGQTAPGTRASRHGQDHENASLAVSRSSRRREYTFWAEGPCRSCPALGVSFFSVVPAEDSLS